MARWRFLLGSTCCVAIFAGLLLASCSSPHAPSGSPPAPSVAPPSTSSSTSTSSAPPSGASSPSSPFSYGFDLSTQEPDRSAAGSGDSAAANRSALSAMGRLRGVYVDQAIYGFGVDDPEPQPGVYNLGSLAARISLITSEGDVPVITLVSAPNWMKTASSATSGLFNTPPTPEHYQDFAGLCAHIAQSFSQVKYFVVWSEVRGFFKRATQSWDYQDYTTMYNDVYEAIKKVRPDARVGGPYAAMTTQPRPVRGQVATLTGVNGYFDRGMLQAVSYWLANKVGADFVAVDGATEVAKSDDAGLETPAAAAVQYAAVDAWIRTQTDLPIWWMESHIQPSHGWSAQQAAAARVATLAEMATSGASVGMQWQPQEQAGWPDEGLWTSTLIPGGGQPTELGNLLLTVLPVIETRPRLVGSQPSGVIVATDSAGTVAINTTNQSQTATANGKTIPLQPGQVQLIATS